MEAVHAFPIRTLSSCKHWALSRVPSRQDGEGIFRITDTRHGASRRDCRDALAFIMRLEDRCRRFTARCVPVDRSPWYQMSGQGFDTDSVPPCGGFYANFWNTTRRHWGGFAHGNSTSIGTFPAHFHSGAISQDVVPNAGWLVVSKCVVDFQSCGRRSDRPMSCIRVIRNAKVRESGRRGAENRPRPGGF